jgi:AbrB family looped-hinge helix DNA binding protein
MKAKITSKGQITLPKKLRENLNLKPGDILEFEEGLPYLKARSAFDLSRMRSVIGRGSDHKRTSSREQVEDMRGPVELP